MSESQSLWTRRQFVVGFTERMLYDKLPFLAVVGRRRRDLLP